MADINVKAVLAKLNTSEKIDLLSGIDFWHTKGFPEHGVPSLRLSDGPNGVRGTKNLAGVPAACFPCGTALGATFSVPLLEEAGRLMGHESIAKGAHILLGPCINMQRSPLGGRGFESLSEDPVVAGLGAAAMIRGIQKTGVVATIKHFVCNDQEHERGLYDAVITERALREIYLRPFQIALKEGGKGGPGAVMTAYNKLNGRHVSEHKILSEVLRGEWGWEGLVMSDWFGTYSTSGSINAGLDLEMPGPTRWRGGNLLHALRSNKVSYKTLDERAEEVLRVVKRCAASNIPENAPEGTIDTPETAALLRKLAGESIVLMKNEKEVLPLAKDKSASSPTLTVIIGPNAKVSVFCGGGSSSLNPYYAVSPFDGISNCLSTEPQYTVGCYAHKELPILGPSLTTTKSGSTPGVTFRSYTEPPSVENRKAVDEISLTKTDMLLLDYKRPAITSPLWYADLGLCVYGTAKLYVDSKMVIDNETAQRQGSVFYGCGTVEEKGIIQVTKGASYHIKVVFASAPTNKLGAGGVVRFGGGGIRIGGCPIMDPKMEIEKAKIMAEKADQVIICAGLNADWEGDGADRANMELSGHMNKLISTVAAANPNTVVVMQAGTPVEMPWISEVSALVHAWYGGNETGNAIADVLFGQVNPSGKLPLSFPIRNEDNPAFLNYRSERGRTLYGEDVYIGYRYYEMTKRDVLFPFGHGLSYTTFSLSNLKVAQEDQAVVVSLKVKNTGRVAGAEVVQVYVAQKAPLIRRPKKELKGFTKIYLEAGEDRVVSVELVTREAACLWDEARASWVVEKDTYEVIVGNSSAGGEGTLRGSFDVKESFWWNGL
ncbi:glycoside hydrolase superfamily [Ilyonectria robusta]|uniref:glycoside hydrolase superfamily n=1 Tax=Ilyonectria robusta TaxID=1079257 RepID=UPI001E8EC276|nr:glycoside hydrolase superfamily [Ilyonectria robusta]KAH8694614.1 glycoside hydrolase superfamily [Ilyonectria robusta]